jgi:large subunit ribosomal protein L35
MGYKLKTKKSVQKRFKVTATGKLKRGHCKTSHLMSARSSKTKRHLGRPAIMVESFARNMRVLIGASHKNPAKLAHKRALAARKAGKKAVAAAALA